VRIDFQSFLFIIHEELYLYSLLRCRIVYHRPIYFLRHLTLWEYPYLHQSCEFFIIQVHILSIEDCHTPVMLPEDYWARCVDKARSVELDPFFIHRPDVSETSRMIGVLELTFLHRDEYSNIA
jgi:hypothetical protein